MKREKRTDRETHVLRSEKLPVDRPDEVSVEESSILNGFGENDTDESEEGQMIWVDRTELVELVGRSSAGRGFELGKKEETKLDIGEINRQTDFGLTKAKLGLKIDLARTLEGRERGKGSGRVSESRERETKDSREPLSSNSSGIDSLLVPEPTAELSVLDLLR